MTYTALARKWRPRTFSSLLGQEHIKRSIVSALNTGRVHHAYLFSGTRGVGKTSIARLIAKSLNCEQGISATPCLSCSNCLSIEQGNFIDLIEVDAASRTRVEDTRELLDNVQYVPTYGRFKVYLIDEVHMLSNHSFNALLKTLEEPPEHVKFLLATTDPQKLPVTILSRCLQYNLRPLTEQTIASHLAFILNDEAIAFEDEAIQLIAHAAEGSVRDALSLLDQAIAGCDGQLSKLHVTDLLGYSRKRYALAILHAIKASSANALLSISQEILLEGGPFQYVLDDLLNHLHQIAVSQAIPNTVEASPSASEVQYFATQFSPEDIQLLYQIGIKAREEMHLAPSYAIAFDMTLLRMLTFIPLKTVSAPLSQVDHVQLAHPIPTLMTHEATPSEQIPFLPPVFENPVVQEMPVDSTTQPRTVETDWPTILPKLNLTGLALNAAENAVFVSKDNSRVTLQIERGHKSVFTSTVIKRLEQGLSDYYQETIQLHLDCIQAPLETPAVSKRQAHENLQIKTEASLAADAFVQALQATFSGELVQSSIAPLKDSL